MRGLDKRFLDAMREKLEHGRSCGRNGWDTHWKYGLDPEFLMSRLHEEMDELVIALASGSNKLILNEAADVANFAMFIADWNS